MIEIKKATSSDISQILPLFDDYRKFYRKEISAEAKSFLMERISQNESVLLMALDGNKVIGFAQIYFSFSSIQLCKTAILNDLFVIPEYRRKKVATMLIDSTIENAAKLNCKSVGLSTQISNTIAQDLYKKKGFKKDNDFFYFNFNL